MATYTAVIGDTASIGQGANLADPSSSVYQRRNPALAAARIRTIINPHVVSDAVGGLLSADFTVPAEEAMRWRPNLRYGATLWLFDGGTPIFYGWLEQPVWSESGDCQVTASGPWALLGRSRTRDAWEIWDMSVLTQASGANENQAGQVTVTSSGTLRMGWPIGTTLTTNDHVSVDYLLFGEPVGPDDDKTLKAFEFNITDNNFSGLAARFRVIGKATASANTGDQLYDTNSTGSSGVQGGFNLNGTNQGAVQWTATNGYRCLRFELIYTGAGTTLTNDRYVILDRIRMGTREGLFPAAGFGIDTADIARDVLTLRGSVITASRHDMPQEFWPSSVGIGSPDSNTSPYLFGLDPRIPMTSTPKSGVAITGFSALEWQSPADILAALAAIDSSHVGFYLPYNGRGGYDHPGGTGTGADVGSYWLSAPPQLYYQPFPDPVYKPDYTIHVREGAQVELNTDSQPLVDVEYVNYQTIRGRQLSVVTTDSTTQNYAYAQGFRRAEDYNVEPAVGDATMAASIAQQQMMVRRQPVSAATITIENDGASRYPILHQGAIVPKLATIRPGSVRIVDVSAASGLRAGYVTHVEWWGQTLDSNEHAELTLAQPGVPGRERIYGILVNRTLRQRHRIL